MPRYCLLDELPVEILHGLFIYFSAHEILLTFSDVSDYIDGVLFAYPTWQLNLKSIRKDHFDLICERIQPEKVISLTLSDDSDTPGQSELFFHRFKIEQFRHLRSLKLVKIEYESLENIFSNLDKLEQLISLSFEVYSITHKYLPSCNSMGIQSRHLHAILPGPYARILPRLTRLRVSSGFDIQSIPFLQLRHLKIASHCQQDEFKKIIQHAPVLQSLDIDLQFEHQNVMKIILASSQLTRLRLTAVGSETSMNQIEQFLPNFPQFDVDSHLQSIESFQTSFWREEKRWHVDYYERSVFSVPHFAPAYIDISKQSRQRPATWFKSMDIQDVPNNQQLYYPYIENLSINYSIPSARTRCLVNLEQIKYLSILSISDLLVFQPYESAIPNLGELRIKNAITLDKIKQIASYQFKSIRRLTIFVDDKDIDSILKELFHCFPCIECLIYLSAIDSMERLTNIIDRFVYLTNATFYSGHLFYIMTMASYFHSGSIIQHSQRLNENNFTYRLQRMPSFSTGTHWWIAPQPVQPSLVNQQLSGLQSIWHWMQHFIFSA